MTRQKKRIIKILFERKERKERKNRLIIITTTVVFGMGLVPNWKLLEF